MADSLEKRYPPYEGTEPYLHLCFSDADARRVRPLLHRLFVRGVRIWYRIGRAKTAAVRSERDERMLGASLNVVFLTDTFRSDGDAKNELLVCQRKRRAVVCLNTDGKDSGLSIGLNPNTPEYPAPDAGEAEDALLHAEGFTQSLIGPPQKPNIHWIRRATVTAGVIAAVLIAAVAGFFLFRKSTDPILNPVETVAFSDASVENAVAAAIGRPLTEERLGEVVSIQLSGDLLPEDLSDLAKLPNLQRIELTQSAALDVKNHPELYGYALVLIGGDPDE